MDRMPCRLIKPAKSDIQKISDILDEIIFKIRNSTKLNKWRSTHAAEMVQLGPTGKKVPEIFQMWYLCVLSIHNPNTS